ncbi:molybdenum cofactor cytidylyltransferase [Microbacterium sp. cf046]|uniref:nucleotidyltransferase family protein n=1 Tax=Microbacterium sp. cf046 TaxID=1761803 RepID=UPI0008E07B16|nr:NTP transferase domain-containing protein [Microbacterium sp. cf046]SFR89254.1 molybdenum cofactor cytidylyltransferase [Microbacterium sp. cf046]
MGTPVPALCGLVLAAGAGARFGGPKALAREGDGTPWVVLAARMLRDAGCDHVLVLLGASADRARPLVPPEAQIVVVDHWQDGLSATLRAGLDAASALRADAALITPVDTPAAPADAAARVTERAGSPLARGLARATYAGRPGHPVLIGRDHWDALRETLHGDSGAGAYLSARGATSVECGDLWSGADVDRQR